MRICLVDNRFTASATDGAARYVAQLGPALAPDHRVSIVTVQGDAIHLPQAVAAIRKMVLADRPDVVHLNNLSGFVLAAVLSAIHERIPLAISIHDYRLVAHLRGLNRSQTRRCGLVISPSNYALGQHLRHGFFSDAIKLVLPYGIDETPSPQSPSPLAGSQSPSPLVGPAGPREPRFSAMRAFEASVEGRDGGLFIFRSIYPEPFPVAIQEAFAAGKVVIASRIGGIPEMIRDGVNGLLVEPGDEPAIAAAVERLEKSPELAARLRASALETARLYDMRFHVARLTEAYRELITATKVGELDRPAA